MAIEAVASFLSSAKTLLDLWKGVREEMPNDAKSEEIKKQIEKTEGAAKTMEAEIARELGFRLCRCTFPPQIMLWNKDQKRSICTSCGDVYPPDPPNVVRGEGRLAAARRGYGRSA